jgi:hypothetical protein
MALAASTLSAVCSKVADLVRELFSGAGHVNVMVGAPAAAGNNNNTEHRVNLFFYRFEPEGYGGHTGPHETWWLRVHCIITAFGIAEEKVSAGENDLRLLGEVIRLFNEMPVSDFDVGDETVQVQIVPVTLSLDDINRLWSTQKDVAYRPSVAYEIGLIPIVPKLRDLGDGRLVGAIGLQTRPDMDARRAFSGGATPPPFVPADIDPSREDWAPDVCFLHGGAWVQTLTLPFALVTAGVKVAVAGVVGAKASLQWETWNREQGWIPSGNPVGITIRVPAIVPDPSAILRNALTMIDVPRLTAPGQAVLYAVRSYGENSSRNVRSHPLLVSVYREMP